MCDWKIAAARSFIAHVSLKHSHGKGLFDNNVVNIDHVYLTTTM